MHRESKPIFNITTGSAKNFNKSEDSFSSGVSSEPSDSEFESCDSQCDKDKNEVDRVLYSFDNQLLKEFQAIVGSKPQIIKNQYEEIRQSKIHTEHFGAEDFALKRHSKKQQIINEAKLKLDKLIEEKISKYESVSYDSMSLDNSDFEEINELDLSHPKRENNLNVVNLYTNHGEIKIPQGLLDLGIHKIFDKEIMGKYLDALTEKEMQTVMDKAGIKGDFVKSLDNIFALSKEHQNGKSDKNPNLLYKNPFLVVERLINEGELSKSEFKYRENTTKAGILRK